MGITFGEGKRAGKLRYTIVVDYGKPYDIKVGTEEQLMKELKYLKELYETGAFYHFDVWVYDENNNDVTDEVFKKYHMM